MKKVVYIAGPLRSRWGRLGRWLNIIRARRVAITLWKAGFAVVCPHLNSVTLRHHVDEDTLVDGDCYIVAKCDFIVMLDGWPDSVGATAEYEAAGVCDIPTYTSVEYAVFKEG